MIVMKKQYYLAVVAVICAFLMSSLPAGAAPEVGEAAPPLKGTLFSGERFDLAEMRGKVVLINYYSSYSKHGAIEIGNTEAFLEVNRDNGLVVIFIGVDRKEDRHRVERMVKLYNLEGIMTHDLEQNGFGEKYRTPRAFVVDRQGIVRSREYGGKTPIYFQKFLVPPLTEPLLAE
jgi:cytochrome c biogenesis protein CcmG/thiol:disulfide interchange protein DsbE